MDGCSVITNLKSRSINLRRKFSRIAHKADALRMRQTLFIHNKVIARDIIDIQDNTTIELHVFTIKAYHNNGFRLDKIRLPGSLAAVGPLHSQYAGQWKLDTGHTGQWSAPMLGASGHSDRSGTNNTHSMHLLSRSIDKLE